MEKFCLGHSWELKGKCYINLDKIWKEEKYPKHIPLHIYLKLRFGSTWDTNSFCKAITIFQSQKCLLQYDRRIYSKYG